MICLVFIALVQTEKEDLPLRCSFSRDISSERFPKKVCTRPWFSALWWSMVGDGETRGLGWRLMSGCETVNFIGMSFGGLEVSSLLNDSSRQRSCGSISWT